MPTKVKRERNFEEAFGPGCGCWKSCLPPGIMMFSNNNPLLLMFVSNVQLFIVFSL